MKKVSFHEAATAELSEALSFYKKEDRSLGWKFLHAIDEATVRIGMNPLLFPIVEGEIRRCLVRTFPFSIIFRVKRDRLFIIAVAHSSRLPGYWKDRE